MLAPGARRSPRLSQFCFEILLFEASEDMHYVRSRISFPTRSLTRLLLTVRDCQR